MSKRKWRRREEKLRKNREGMQVSGRSVFTLQEILKKKVGTTQVDLDLPDEFNVAGLKKLLLERYPNLPQSPSSLLVAVNKQYAFDKEEIPQGAEIAVFPPVSGGSAERGAEFPTVFSITEDSLDLNAILAQITRPSTGAACFFSGVVRGVTSGSEAHETERLEYEAYVPMAEAKMQQVADEILSRWPEGEGIGIGQRGGKLMP